MRAVKSVSIDSERRVIITYLDGSTETLYPNCIWCDSEALRQLIKDLLEEKADAITQTIENVTIASFADGADEGLIKKLLVSIDPIQDMHGYESPWPRGGGVNIIPDGTNVDNGFVSGHYLKSDGTLGAGNYNVCEYFPVTAGATYTCCKYGSLVANVVSICFYNSEKTYISGEAWNNRVNFQVIAPEDSAFARTVISTQSDLNFLVTPGTDVPTSWTPYSNICPISGRTGLTVYRSGSDTSNPTEFPVTWETEAGTVYGGTLDVVSGKLSVDRRLKTFVGATSEGWSFGSGAHQYFYCTLETLNAGINSEVVCDTFPNNGQISGGNNTQGVYVFNSTAYNGFTLYLRWNALGVTTLAELRNWLHTNNITICYKLTTLTEIQLTPQEVTTLLGDNNIWVDSGNILELEYTADTKLYIGEQGSGTSGALGSGKQTTVKPDLQPVSEKTWEDVEEAYKEEATYERGEE